jgi:hypothetical protein
MTNEIETGTFEQRAREVFDASVDGIDAATRSRLNHARQAATAELERSRRSPWLTWAPAGALAAAALVAVLLWRAPGTGDVPAQQAQATPDPADAAEILAAGDDLDLATEDLDFYEFVSVATSDPGKGDG